MIKWVRKWKYISLSFLLSFDSLCMNFVSRLKANIPRKKGQETDQEHQHERSEKSNERERESKGIPDVVCLDSADDDASLLWFSPMILVDTSSQSHRWDIDLQKYFISLPENKEGKSNKSNRKEFIDDPKSESGTPLLPLLFLSDSSQYQGKDFLPFKKWNRHDDHRRRRQQKWSKGWRSKNSKRKKSKREQSSLCLKEKKKQWEKLFSYIFSSLTLLSSSSTSLCGVFCILSELFSWRPLFIPISRTFLPS